jgi:hypothetical protein
MSWEQWWELKRFDYIVGFAIGFVLLLGVLVWSIFNRDKK